MKIYQSCSFVAEDGCEQASTRRGKECPKDYLFLAWLLASFIC